MGEDPGPIPSDEDAPVCPWCEHGTLVAELSAALTDIMARQRPTVRHHTRCTNCPAKRTLTVRLDRLAEELDGVKGGWEDEPGQGSVGDWTDG